MVHWVKTVKQGSLPWGIGSCSSPHSIVIGGQSMSGGLLSMTLMVHAAPALRPPSVQLALTCVVPRGKSALGWAEHVAAGLLGVNTAASKAASSTGVKKQV